MNKLKKYSILRDMKAAINKLMGTKMEFYWKNGVFPISDTDFSPALREKLKTLPEEESKEIKFLFQSWLNDHGWNLVEINNSNSFEIRPYMPLSDEEDT